ncbi:MAG TPA: tRNA pseudouridine(55) synthase TruB [Anaeromyxobacteraceae bacterium]|nr:tRNA pseudouridine(55) synthase TruB [Anaeromyxobacteraceae bacterium]
MSGILVVDKPAGPTSFEVVKRVRRALRADKAGHTGTLDPAATGVLAVCVGEGVKLQQFLTEGDKAYEARVAFGAATETEDAEGAVVARGDPGALDADRIRAALAAFVGEIAQVPPMYSAVRVGGRRLHEAARAGEDVPRAPRAVTVHALELLEVEPRQGDLLHARLAVRCGKGTYVRTLAADLGRALGVPAHLAALRRTAAGPFSLSQAVPLAEVERLGREDPAALAARLVPLEAALGLPRVALEPSEVRDLSHGKAVAARAGGPASGLVCAVGADGRLVAVCAARGDRLQPVRVFPPPGPGGAEPRDR